MVYVATAELIFFVNNDVSATNGAKRELLHPEYLAWVNAEFGADRVAALRQKLPIPSEEYELGDGSKKQGVGLVEVEAELERRLAILTDMKLQKLRLMSDTKRTVKYQDIVLPTYFYSLGDPPQCNHRYVLLNDNKPSDLDQVFEKSLDDFKLEVKAYRLAFSPPAPNSDVQGYAGVELIFWQE